MKVTIGIPFYNAELTLKKTIISILNQTFPDFELILVDDCSTDSSLIIATSFLSDPRVKIIKNKTNLGLSANLNKINNNAKGDIIIRMDHDDIMFPDRVMKIVEAFNENEDCNIIGHSAIIINENDQIVGFRKSPEHTSLIECYFSTRFIHPSVAYRKALVVNNLYNSKFDGCEDQELWYRIFSRSKALILDSALIFYREPSKLKFGTYFRRNLKLLKFFKENKSIAGSWNLVKATMLVYLKIILYALATTFGIDQIFLRSRNTCLLKKDEDKYQDILNKVITNTNKKKS